MSKDKLTMCYERSLEIRYQADVLVVDGGPAGIATALAASRQGASVRLIEAHTCLGGMGTAGMVPARGPRLRSSVRNISTKDHHLWPFLC